MLRAIQSWFVNLARLNSSCAIRRNCKMTQNVRQHRRHPQAKTLSTVTVSSTAGGTKRSYPVRHGGPPNKPRTRTFSAISSTGMKYVKW